MGKISSARHLPNSLAFFRHVFSAVLMCLTYSLQNELYWHFLFPLAVFGKPLHVPGLSVSISRP